MLLDRPISLAGRIRRAPASAPVAGALSKPTASEHGVYPVTGAARLQTDRASCSMTSALNCRPCRWRARGASLGGSPTASVRGPEALPPQGRHPPREPARVRARPPSVRSRPCRSRRPRTLAEFAPCPRGVAESCRAVRRWRGSPPVLAPRQSPRQPAQWVELARARARARGVLQRRRSSPWPSLALAKSPARRGRRPWSPLVPDRHLSCHREQAVPADLPSRSLQRRSRQPAASRCVGSRQWPPGPQDLPAG